MDPTSKPAAKRPAEILVLHCLNPACGGLLAYEVDSNNVLYVDLAWTAKQANGSRYFPCPKCHGKNVVEAFDDEKGRRKHRVTRWEA